jgi:hypothetical protein
MDNAFLKKLQRIILEAFAKKTNFYRIKALSHGIKKKDIEKLDKEVFQTFPITTLQELADTPYRQRSLQEKPGLNKLVFSEGATRYFLIHRTLEEIRKDALPLDGTRPLVLMQDVYEAIERCLFFYAHHVLPLIGEVLNPSVVYAAAQQYRIDSLYIDHDSITNFREGILKLNLPLKAVTVIDSSFTDSDLKWPKGIKIHYIISLPEFGRVAYACPESVARKKLVCHPYGDTFIEPAKQAILTSVRLRSCSMIRYQSKLTFKAVESQCSCEEQYSFVYIQS